MMVAWTAPAHQPAEYTALTIAPFVESHTQYCSRYHQEATLLLSPAHTFVPRHKNMSTTHQQLSTAVRRQTIRNEKAFHKIFECS